MNRLLPLKPRRLARCVAAACAAGMLLHGGAAQALGLMQAYQAALQNDPMYQGAVHENEAGQQNRIIGRAALLPQLSADYSNSHNRADVTATDAFGVPDLTHPVYNSHVAEVTLRQGILNLDAVARYKQGIAQSDYSASQLDLHRQELIVRVAGAYMDVLLSREQLRLAEAQRDVYLEQRQVNDHLFQNGEGTKTDMLETQSRLDLAEAQVLEAQDTLQTAHATLGAIVGADIDVATLDDLAPGFHTLPLSGGGIEEWKAVALANNPEIAAARHGIEAAHQEVNKDRAGHAPKLDFVASYAKNTAQTIDTYNQDSTVRSIGIQLTVPLYSGGSVVATTRQAVAGQEKARSDLQAATDKVMIELRKEYAMVVSSVARIAALDKAVASSELLIKATEQSIKGGVRINLDLLNAQQQLYTSKRDLAQARYNYLTGVLKLRAAAGTASTDDVREVAAFFR